MKKERAPKPKYNMWQNTAWMIGRAWNGAKSVIFLCFALAAAMVASSLVELFVAPMVLGAIESGAGLPTLLWTILAFALALILTSALRSYIESNTLFGRVDIRLGIVKDNAEKFGTTSYPNIESQEFQKLSQKAGDSTNSNNKATEAIWQTLTNLLRDAAGFAIYLALLTAADPLLLGIVLATSVGGYFATKRINGWDYRHREEEAECTRKARYVDYKVRDNKLAKDIRIFGMRPWLEDVYAASMKLYDDFCKKRESVYIWSDIINAVMTLLRNGAAYFYLISLTLAGGLTASQFLLYFAAVGGFTAWVTGILGGFARLHRQSLDISTVREYLEYPEPFDFDGGLPLSPDSFAEWSLELRGVSFRYPGADSDTIKHMNLVIKPGEKLAVVGLNGAGKTTTIRLLCGFYDPTEGEVLLNGVNIKKYNRRDYYSCFSAVFQQFSLIATNIAENIAQTDRDSGELDMARVKDSAERAGIADRIEEYPGKYETHVGRDVYEDGAELSGGETQRLMLARALYKDAPVILLDEPTAALDPIAERDMYTKYNELTQGRTSVYISHRLASTRFCDRIILIENGEITEEGTHESLLALGGRYAELFGVQSRYYGQEAVRNVEE